MKSSLKLKSGVRLSMIGLIILAMMVTLLGTSVPVLAATQINLYTNPSPPYATIIGASQGTGFDVSYDSTPDYVIYKVIRNSDNSTRRCLFYDISGNWGPNLTGIWKVQDTTYTPAYDTCWDTSSRVYTAYLGTSPMDFASLLWSTTGQSAGSYTFSVKYYSTTGGNNPEKTGTSSFLLTSSTTTGSISIQKFEDVNADGYYTDGIDFLWNNGTIGGSPIDLCITILGVKSCKTTGTSGLVSWNNIPTGTYTFSETKINDWGLTPIRPTASHSLTSTENYTQYIGNAHADMTCAALGVTISPLTPDNKMVYTLNYQKLYTDDAKGALVALYFDNTALPALNFDLFTSTIINTGSDGSDLNNPYIFEVGDIIGTNTTGDVSVTLQLTFPSGKPTSGTFVANMEVASSYEPNNFNNTCSQSITFAPTAVNASSLTAQPQGSGVQLGWWADVAGTDWLGFKLQSKLHTADMYTDVPGGYVAADPTAVGGKDYAFLDTGAKTGYIDYQVVPVTSGGDAEPVLWLTTYYGKFYIPTLSR